VPGADLGGVHLAMDYLPQQNRRIAGDTIPEKGSGAFCAEHPSGRSGKRLLTPFPIPIHAKGKHVIVVGGGDTGSDCVGTAIRQGALSVRQLEILPRPPEGKKNPETPWPNWPKIMRTSSSQEEGCQRHWSALTKALVGTNGQVTHLVGCEIDWVAGPKGWEMQEVPGTDFTFPADLVLIAMGFVHVVHEGLIGELGLQLDRRGNVIVEHWMSSVPGVFAAGDTVRGASLVVHAINHGRLAAAAVDRWLKANGQD
jgi:glutamate synthase (NADPH/NADH) small chain